MLQERRRLGDPIAITGVMGLERPDPKSNIDPKMSFLTEFSPKHPNFEVFLSKSFPKHPKFIARRLRAPQNTQ